MNIKDVDIVCMARDAGINNDCDGIWCNADQLTRFAELVAAHEREECAKLCDSEWSGDADAYDYSIASNECAAAIRKRSKT